MGKRVLDVGNCDPDHAAIRRLIEGAFSATVDRAHQWDDAQRQLRAGHYDLVLVNRKLDIDYSEGLDIIKSLKADPQFCAIPVMMITNYPEHQHTAVAAGAVDGFGKQELAQPATREKLARLLG